MTEYIHAAILGIVQGIAEFLPISSSGHLVIVGELLQEFANTSIPAESATMSIALHFGTLLSILVVYRKELPAIVLDTRLVALILLATVPVGVVGLLFKDHVAAVFNTPLVAGEALIVTAVFLIIGHQLQRRQQQPASLGIVSACVIGLFQAVAIIPGISRSGSTIAAGQACGIPRDQAARFSFLIAIPAIAGAALVKAIDLLTGDEAVDTNYLPLLLGTATAFVVGVVALSWLLRIVMSDRLHWFAGYCLIVGLATIIWQWSVMTGNSESTAMSLWDGTMLLTGIDAGF